MLDWIGVQDVSAVYNWANAIGRVIGPGGIDDGDVGAQDRRSSKHQRNNEPNDFGCFHIIQFK